MLLAFVIWSTIALSIANPLHKYPYVFLLDVGNEELQKTNTEQLRVSIPGGSLAMKYPAMGEGDPISHVRVSGIDFGTDLKVNIVEGGPGYKYVVLMFIGNAGVTYDAVVTLQTLQTLPSSTESSLINSNEIVSTKNLTPYEVTDADYEDNDQDLTNDPQNMKQYSSKSKEVMQSTSTFYNYAKDKMANGDVDKESQNVSAEEDEDNDDNDSEDAEDEEGNDGEHELLNKDKHNSSNEEEESGASNGYEDENEEADSVKVKLYNGQSYNQFGFRKAEQNRFNVHASNAYKDKPSDIENDNPYDKYQELKPHFGYRIYPQGFIYNSQYQDSPVYDKEDPVEFEQMINNEINHNDARFKGDSNNPDSDYLVAEY